MAKQFQIPTVESGMTRVSNGLLFLNFVGVIILLALLAVTIAGYVGCGFLTKPLFQTKKDKNGDVLIVLKSNDDSIPVKNQLILMQIFVCVFWISLAFSIINMIVSYSFKVKVKVKS